LPWLGPISYFFCQFSEGDEFNLGKVMEKAGAVLLGLFILSGCALPVPFRIATWAIDGISFVTTEKDGTPRT
jgi:hypothetical protein